MASTDPRRGPFALVFVLALVAVGLALVTQYRWDMQPCPWCVLQRLIFVLVGLAALVGLLWRSRAGAWTSVLAISVLSTLGAVAALWQHFVAAASASCNLTLADRIMSALQLDALLPEVFAATASCAEAKASLLGVPYEFWSLALFILLDAIAVSAVLRRAA
ncbi:MAG: disulfide bond formation protein B [Burkholderiaceae bacterium]